MVGPAASVLCARLAQDEVLVSPERAEYIESLIRGFDGGEYAEQMLAPDMAANDDFWPQSNDWRAAYRPYIVQDGILKIPVMGMLLNRFGYQFGSYATGYTYIQKAVERGLADASVKGIAFIVDSPGGEVAGCFELVDRIFSARGQKPIRAFAADSAYSAAYAIASVADSITMTRSGGVGSIGVVTMHVDYSEALVRQGIKITYIFAGKHKVDGNSYEKLPEAVRARIQARIDRTYSIFTATVARNRKLDEKAVRKTEALTYGSEDAIDVGLADKVAVFEDAIAAYADELRNPGDDTMTDISKADHDAAVAAATVAGTSAGVTAERTRIAAIMALDEAKGRTDTALTLATTTDLSVEQAKGLLATVPEAKPAAASAGHKKLFEAAMGATGNPGVGAGGGDDEGETEQSASARMLSNYSAQSGFTPKSARK